MRSIVLLLVACAGYALKLQKNGERLQGQSDELINEASLPLRSLATLLLASSTAAGFNPSRPAMGLRASTAGSTSAVRMSLSAGDNVLVYGNGPVMCLAARLAAIRGYKVSLISQGEDQADAKILCFDEVNHPEGSIPLTLLPISGPDADAAMIEEARESADAVIVAFDSSASLISDKALDVCVPETSKIKHVACLSRYLNGEGMGFWANAAKVSSNPDVWTAPAPLVEAYKDMESRVKERATKVGASCTFIRAGTLKGGACGELGSDNGENTFLNPYLYKLGQQDLVNWRLLYDTSMLGVEISKGDTLPGPGFWAITRSRDGGGDGDSHRGAVAAALVESLSNPSAQNGDWSVKTVESRKFPSVEELGAMFEKA